MTQLTLGIDQIDVEDVKYLADALQINQVIH